MPRQPKQPAAAKIAALEALDGSVFDENYRRRVVAALPPGTTASEEFWADLEAAFNTYLLWELRRLRRPPLAEREQWRRIESLSTDLTKELLPLHRQTPRRYSDPDWAKPILAELMSLRGRARAHMQAYDAIAKGYRRRSNSSRRFPFRQHLGDLDKASQTARPEILHVGGRAAARATDQIFPGLCQPVSGRGSTNITHDCGDHRSHALIGF